MKDTFGNELTDGDYFAYSISQHSRVFTRVGRVGADGQAEKIATPGWGSNWTLIRGRPNSTVHRIYEVDIPEHVRELLA